MTNSGVVSAPVALVTGASRGIGASTAEHLAAAGYRVMLSARGSSALVDKRKSIESSGGIAANVPCDIGDQKQVFRLIEETMSKWKRIDVLINNAGTMEPIGQVADIDPQAMQRHIQTNLVGPFTVCRAVLPVFLQAQRGILINVSSGAAGQPLAGWGLYCCSKAALAMLTRVLHLEVGEQGIRVYGFRPGMVNTELTRNALKVKVNRISELDPAGFLDPAEPARAIAWLCSDAAIPLAGQELDFNDPDFRRLIPNLSKGT